MPPRRQSAASVLNAPTHFLCVDPSNSSNAIVYRPSTTSSPAPSPSSSSFKTFDKLVRASVPLSTLPAESASLAADHLSNRRVLIIVNPRAGKQSRRVQTSATRTIKRILHDAGIPPFNIQLLETTAPRDATRLVIDAVRVSNASSPTKSTGKLNGNGGGGAGDRIDVVLAVGGDGTLFEVVDGLVQCANATPVVPVPTGSGNAVAVSMRLPTVTHATLNAINGLRDPTSTAKPACLLRYRRCANSAETGDVSSDGDGKKEIGMETDASKAEERTVICGVQWGLPAQVDQGTEWMRFMGDARFTVGALGHILSKREYHARFVVDVHNELQKNLSGKYPYLPAEYADDAFCSRSGPAQYTFDGRFIMVVAWTCQAIAKDFVVTPAGRVTETEAFDVVVVPGGLSRMQQLSVLLNAEDGTFLRQSEKLGIKYFKATSLSVLEMDGDFLTVDGEPVPLQPYTLDIAPESGAVRVFDTLS